MTSSSISHDIAASSTASLGMTNCHSSAIWALMLDSYYSCIRNRICLIKLFLHVCIVFSQTRFWQLRHDNIIIISTVEKVSEHNPPWEADSCPDGQETLFLSWNLNVNYNAHKNLLLDPILNQMNLLHTLAPYFFKVHFNIILPSMPRSLKWSVPFRFSD